MAHHDDETGGGGEDAADLTIEDTTGLGTGLTLEVDALAGEMDTTAHTLDDIGTEAAHHLIGTGDRHGQTALVAGETATELAVGVGIAIALGIAAGITVIVGHGTLHILTLGLSLTGTLLGSLLLFGIAGGTGLLASLLLTGLGLGQTALTIAALTFLAGLLFGQALLLSLDTGFFSCYLFGNEFFNLRIEVGLLLLLLGDEVLHGLLLLLQLVDEHLLLALLRLHLATLGLATAEQGTFLGAGGLQLLLLLLHLLLLLLDGLALGTLVGGVLVHETGAAVHLVDGGGAEDEQGLVLGLAVAAHIAHGLAVVVLTLAEFLLQHDHLGVEQGDMSVEGVDLDLDGVEGQPLHVYLVAQREDVLHLLAHAAVQFGLLTFVLGNVVTHTLTLGLGLLTLRGLLLTRGGLLLLALLDGGCGGLATGRRGALLRPLGRRG